MTKSANSESADNNINTDWHVILPWPQYNISFSVTAASPTLAATRSLSSRCLQNLPHLRASRYPQTPFIPQNRQTSANLQSTNRNSPPQSPNVSNDCLRRSVLRSTADILPMRSRRVIRVRILSLPIPSDIDCAITTKNSPSNLAGG